MFVQLQKSIGPSRERQQYLRMSEEERRIYDHYLDTLIRDTDVMKTKLLEAVIQGHKKGMAQGMAQGKDEANRENAKRMKDKGYSIEDIADITGLTVEMIEQL